MWLSENHDKPTQELIDYWWHQDEHCTDKNRDWFKGLIHKPKYEKYWILKESNFIVAFSCIQFVEFPTYTCRIGTRTFIDPNYRNVTSSKERYNITPIFQMLTEQYDWVKSNTDKANCFSSMEHNRTAALKASAKKFNLLKKIPARVLSDRYMMFNDKTHPSCYQNILLFPITSERFDLPKLKL